MRTTNTKYGFPRCTSIRFRDVIVLEARRVRGRPGSQDRRQPPYIFVSRIARHCYCLIFPGLPKMYRGIWLTDGQGGGVSLCDMVGWIIEASGACGPEVISTQDGSLGAGLWKYSMRLLVSSLSDRFWNLAGIATLIGLCSTISS